jgi:hypothetical protein
MNPTKLDPDLERQLDTDTLEFVDAIVRVRSDKPGEIVPSPERTEALAHELVERIQERLGIQPHDINIFRNLGYFIVAAPIPFIRALIAQPEVAAAMANRSDEDVLIRPVKKPGSPAKVTKPARSR